jgi:site-specific recombinase XerD
MIGACERTRYGLRNKTILLMLIDTGIRVSELCSLNVEDVCIETGEVTIRHGKGDKPRSVFLGVKTRRELVKYLRIIQRNDNAPLFLGKTSLERITRRGVASMLEAVAKTACVPIPTPHDFRRAFTRSALENMDVITVSRLLGHSSTQVVWRYFYQQNDDLRRAHEKASPADKL